MMTTPQSPPNPKDPKNPAAGDAPDFSETELNAPALTGNESFRQWLMTVEDPELFLPIAELGLIYTGELDDQGKATIQMTLTSPGCPAGQYLVDEVRKRMLQHPEVKDCDVKIVWEPKWDPKTMASEECKETLGIW